MATKKTKRSGPPSVFHGKIRKPVSLTLTPAHHLKVRQNVQRLDITRADLIGLLIEKYADKVTLDGSYKRVTIVEKKIPTMEIPTAAEYKEALSAIDISGKERRMFEVHYRARNRSISYGAIDDALDYKAGAANLRYGRLAAKLGRALEFTYDKLSENSETDWFSSVIGMEDTTPRPDDSLFHFVMHHELATALAEVFPEFCQSA